MQSFPLSAIGARRLKSFVIWSWRLTLRLLENHRAGAYHGLGWLLGDAMGARLLLREQAYAVGVAELVHRVVGAGFVI